MSSVVVDYTLHSASIGRGQLDIDGYDSRLISKLQHLLKIDIAIEHSWLTHTRNDAQPAVGIMHNSCRRWFKRKTAIFLPSFLEPLPVKALSSYLCLQSPLPTCSTERKQTLWIETCELLLNYLRHKKGETYEISLHYSSPQQLVIRIPFATVVILLAR